MVNRIKNLFALSTAVLIVTAITGCDAPPSPEETRKKSLDNVGMDASFTAGFLVSATRQCQIIGVNDIDECAQLKGTLLAEKTIPVFARIAVTRRDEYWKKCQADFDQEYCAQLIQRAVAIELRTPRTSEGE